MGEITHPEKWQGWAWDHKTEQMERVSGRYCCADFLERDFVCMMFDKLTADHLVVVAKNEVTIKKLANELRDSCECDACNWPEDPRTDEPCPTVVFLRSLGIEVEHE